MKSSNKKLLIGSLILLTIGGGYFLYKKKFMKEISDKGIKFLIDAEGFVNKAYQDVKGLWTIGVGHLIDTVKEKHLLSAVLTKKQVEDLFDKDLDRFEKCVTDTIKVPLPAYKKDALINLAFNIGEGAFKKSTLAKLINAKATDAEIAKAFAAWNKPAQIRGRRAKEIRLFFKGNYSPVISKAEIETYMSGVIPK